MSRDIYINFTKKHVEYLMDKLGADEPQEAIDTFAEAIKKERVDPGDMIMYLTRLMEKDGVK